MGVYIKGMEMPKDGEKLYMITFSDGKACASYKPFEWHEVVPVPPHGRLIDKDALEADISASVVFSGRDGNAEIVGAKKIINRLHLAPTIIPAEEGET